MKILLFNIPENIDKVDLSSISTKFVSEKRNLEYSIGRLLVRYGAFEFFGVDDVKIDETFAKPRIVDDKFYFSISHSHDYVAVAFDNAEIGFDIEKIKDKNYEKIAQRMNFNCKNLKEFYQEWTKYEAIYKSGINIAENFRFKDYMCAISGNVINSIKFYNVKLLQNNFDFLMGLLDNISIEEVEFK